VNYELSIPNKIDDFVLCYVSLPWCYFTSQFLQKQWGDDWNDAPYEHNAGLPYDDYTGKNRWQIIKVAADTSLSQPCDMFPDHSFSVEQINAGAVSWLQNDMRWETPNVTIPAGTTLRDFISIIYSNGGSVYAKLNHTVKKD
jgi:hypothetical protein